MLLVAICGYSGPQFVARDFKEFVREAGMTQARAAPGYPQGNGKIERWHKSIKHGCIRPKPPVSLEDARTLVEGYVNGYITQANINHNTFPNLTLHWR